MLLLCFAVQKFPNNDIIEGIRSLSSKVQTDMKFFIENTFAQVKTPAILTGTFQSGIGEPLSSLEPTESSPPSQCNPSSSDGQDGVSRSSSMVSLPRNESQESVSFPTPCRPSKSLNPGKFYNGLNSPAGLRWLQSPGIAKSRTVRRTPLASSISATSLQSQCVVGCSSVHVDLSGNNLLQQWSSGGTYIHTYIRI